MAGRRDWRAAVRSRAGDEAAAAVRDYQTAVTELAFLRHRMARGTVGFAAGRWHHEVLGALMAARARAVNAPNALGSAWRLPPPPGWSTPPNVLPPNVLPPTPAGDFVLPHPPGQPGRYLPYPPQPMQSGR
jgi:hypothetical protein